MQNRNVEGVIFDIFKNKYFVMFNKYDHVKEIKYDNGPRLVK